MIRGDNGLLSVGVALCMPSSSPSPFPLILSSKYNVVFLPSLLPCQCFAAQNGSRSKSTMITDHLSHSTTDHLSHSTWPQMLFDPPWPPRWWRVPSLSSLAIIQPTLCCHHKCFMFYSCGSVSVSPGLGNAWDEFPWDNRSVCIARAMSSVSFLVCALWQFTFMVVGQC